MTTYNLDDSELQALNGKTIVITGGLCGIGRAAVRIAQSYGANVAIADWDEAEGELLKAELQDCVNHLTDASRSCQMSIRSIIEKPGRVIFHKCDVSNWDDVLSLFEITISELGPIDAVLSNADLTTEDFASTIDKVDPATGKLLPPDIKTVEVNLIGQIYMVKAALHYFLRWKDDGKTRQIVMTGSAASFIECPPLHLHCTSKTGVLGLMRSMRTQIWRRRATINMVAPWVTVLRENGTAEPLLLPYLKNVWGVLPANNAEGPARALLLPVVRPDLNGKPFYVAGNQIVEVEDKLHEAQPIWLGEKLSKSVDEGQRRLIPMALPI